MSGAEPIGQGVVSIHAPAWGATACVFCPYHNQAVSIHAPAWGATIPRRRGVTKAGFNPRARVGRDLQLADIIVYDKVSIHAPAWGATLAERLSMIK